MSRILLTGAAGEIGSLLRGGLRRPGRTLRLADLVPLEPGPGEEALTVDLRDPVYGVAVAQVTSPRRRVPVVAGPGGDGLIVAFG
ncbi:MAG: hypothetical protein ACRDU8_02485 [Egibacteraceae bacterium]